MLTLPTITTEYVKVPVSAFIGGTAVDPQSDTVSLAWVADGTQPLANDFVVGSWEADSSATPTVYYARRLLSAGALAAGTWVVWVKVIHGSEVVVRPAGPVHLY